MSTLLQISVDRIQQVAGGMLPLGIHLIPCVSNISSIINQAKHESYFDNMTYYSILDYWNRYNLHGNFVINQVTFVSARF